MSPVPSAERRGFKFFQSSMSGTEDERGRQRRADQQQADAGGEQRRPQTFDPRLRHDGDGADDLPGRRESRMRETARPASLAGIEPTGFLSNSLKRRLDDPVGRRLRPAVSTCPVVNTAKIDCDGRG